MGNLSDIFKDFSGQQKNSGLFQDVATLMNACIFSWTLKDSSIHTNHLSQNASVVAECRLQIAILTYVFDVNFWKGGSVMVNNDGRRAAEPVHLVN